MFSKNIRIVLVLTFVTFHFITCAICEGGGLRESGQQYNCRIAESDVPPDFIKIGVNYYRIVTDERLNWYRAAQACRRLNAHLANIINDYEMTVISDYLWQNGFNETVTPYGTQGEGNQYWYSPSCLGRHHGDFYSSMDGQKVNYFRWSPGNPNNLGGIELCVHVWLYPNYSHYTANDAPCDRELRYICQFDRS